MSEKVTPRIQTTSAERESLRRKRTITIGLTTGSLFLAIILLFAPTVFRSENPNFIGILIAAPVSLIGFLSAYLAAKDKVTLGAQILLGTVLLLAFASPFAGKGQGVSLGMVTVMLGIGISTSSLPRNQIASGVWLSIAAGLATVILDQILPDFGQKPNALYTNITALILSAIFFIIAVRRYNTFSLRSKLILTFLFTTFLSLLILGLYNNYIAEATLTRESRDQLADISGLAANQYDDFFQAQIIQISTDAKQVTLLDYLALPAYLRKNSPEEARALQNLNALQQKNPIFIASYALLDKNGKKVLETYIENAGGDESSQPYFSVPMNTNLPYVSSVMFNEAGKGNFYFSAPIKTPSGSTLGVLRVEYQAAILQWIANDIQLKDPSISIVLLESASYLRLADTQSRAGLYTSALSPELSSQVSAELKAGIDNIQTAPFFTAFSASLNAEAENTGTTLKSQPWVVLVSEAKEKDIQAIRQQTRNIIFVSLAVSLLALVIALGASQLIAAPLISLTRVAEKISAGDTSVRAIIATEDEVGELAQAFNKMTDDLSLTLNDLEARVAERTTDLEISRQQSEKRASELQVVSEISKLISSEQKFENLLPLVARLVSEKFNYYHTGIYLIDETGQFALLHAASSEGGKKMLMRKHMLNVNAKESIVGYVTETGNPRIALDVGQEAVYFNNPDLPGTRSEIALPLIVRKKILGALDVQSDKPGVFTEADIQTLGILADQIAIAIDNARLFEQNQRTLSEYQALYQQNIKTGWASFSQREETLGYRQTLGGGVKITQPIETSEIREALRQGSVLVTKPNKSGETSYIVVPVKLRGQIIGTLRVQAPTKNRTWSKDEVNLAEAVSERLSLALENARLIHESQNQVIKEQTIGEVTAKIGASIDLKNVLQTAVEELGKAMPGSEVLIRFDDHKNGNAPQAENNHA
ncbi:MAG: GAF domain-containing protein [Anaerolineales bacterium]|nr:GAF domain-containing protein [Anaerolineales bacterium]